MKNNEIWSPPKITLLVTTAHFAVPETTATRGVIQMPPGTAMVAITRRSLVVAVIIFSATSGGIFFPWGTSKIIGEQRTGIGGARIFERKCQR